MSMVLVLDCHHSGFNWDNRSKRSMGMTSMKSFMTRIRIKMAVGMVRTSCFHEATWM